MPDDSPAPDPDAPAPDASASDADISAPDPDASVPHVRVALGVPTHLHARASWVCETLLAPYRAQLQIVGKGDDADVGYGVTGSRVTFDYLPAAWVFDELPPVGDAIAEAFWWLARAEERDRDEGAYDQHGRFSYEASAMRDREWRAPVDEIAAALAESLELELAEWPNGCRSALALSHDVDLPVKWSSRGIRSSLGRLKRSLFAGRLVEFLTELRLFVQIPAWRLRGRDPYLNSDEIALMEQRHEGRSTFFVIAGDRKSVV